MEKLVLTDGCGQLVCAPLQLTQDDVFIIHFYQKKKKKKYGQYGRTTVFHTLSLSSTPLGNAGVIHFDLTFTSGCPFSFFARLFRTESLRKVVQSQLLVNSKFERFNSAL